MGCGTTSSSPCDPQTPLVSQIKFLTCQWKCLIYGGSGIPSLCCVVHLGFPVDFDVMFFEGPMLPPPCFGHAPPARGWAGLRSGFVFKDTTPPPRQPGVAMYILAGDFRPFRGWGRLGFGILRQTSEGERNFSACLPWKGEQPSPDMIWGSVIRSPEGMHIPGRTGCEAPSPEPKEHSAIKVQSAGGDH